MSKNIYFWQKFTYKDLANLTASKFGINKILKTTKLVQINLIKQAGMLCKSVTYYVRLKKMVKNILFFTILLKVRTFFSKLGILTNTIILN